MKIKALRSFFQDQHFKAGEVYEVKSMHCNKTYYQVIKEAKKKEETKDDKKPADKSRAKVENSAILNTDKQK